MPEGLRDMDNRYTILRPGGLLNGLEFLHELRIDTGDEISGSIAATWPKLR